MATIEKSKHICFENMILGQLKTGERQVTFGGNRQRKRPCPIIPPGSRTKKTLKVSHKWWKKETISLWWTWYCRTVVESGVTTPCGYLSTIQSGAVAARVGKTSTFDLDPNQLRGSCWASQRLLTSGTHRRPPAASLWSSSGERMRMITAEIHFFGQM